MNLITARTKTPKIIITLVVLVLGTLSAYSDTNGMNLITAHTKAPTPGYGPTRVPYNDDALTPLGRWQDDGKGIWSGWSGGPQIVFKVSGALHFHVVIDVENPDTEDIAHLAYNIDESPNDPEVYLYSPVGEAYTGTKMGLVTLPDMGEHTINLHLSGFNAEQFAGTSKMTLRYILLPTGGAITPWAQGPKYIQAVGDSWMGNTGDWPRLMDSTKWKLYPIAAGGLKASNMDTQYNYKSAGVSATDDPIMDGVVVSFGVNDFNQGITLGNFQTSLLSVVDKIRAKQATAPIFLIQVPKNLGTGDDFGQYETAMENIVGLRANVSYISTRSLESTITWANDSHLDAAGKELLANYIDAALVSAGL